MRHFADYKWLNKFNIFLLLTGLLVFTLSMTGCDDAARMTATVSGNAADKKQLSKEAAVEYVYGIPMDENAGVTIDKVSDIYSSPDVKSNRITQALYNEPVSVLQQEGGWSKVASVDGSIGWMKRKFIDSNVTSVHGRSYIHRIIITSKEKSITSKPSGGITLVEAPMGAEFYAFNNSGDAYEVFLPCNKTGWIKGSGVIHIPLGEMIPITNPDDFAATALRLKGASYLLNGMSGMGIDAPGLVYICARINGVDIPRSISGQMESGIEIKPEESKAGDLLFLEGTGEGDSKTITSVGIGLGEGNYIYSGRKIGYVAISNINRECEEGKVVAARRIFN